MNSNNIVDVYGDKKYFYKWTHLNYIILIIIIIWTFNGNLLLNNTYDKIIFSDCTKNYGLCENLNINKYNNFNWDFINLNKLNKVWIINILLLKKDEFRLISKNFKIDFHYSIIELNENNLEKNSYLIYKRKAKFNLYCNTKKDYCFEENILKLFNIPYNRFRIKISFISEDLNFFGKSIFFDAYTFNFIFSMLFIILNYIFLCLSISIIIFYYKNIRRNKILYNFIPKEQLYILWWNLALILYNNPLYILEFFNINKILNWISIIFKINFYCLIIIFWIYSIIALEYNSKSFKITTNIKITLIGGYLLLFIILLTQFIITKNYLVNENFKFKFFYIYSEEKILLIIQSFVIVFNIFLFMFLIVKSIYIFNNTLTLLPRYNFYLTISLVYIIIYFLYFLTSLQKEQDENEIKEIIIKLTSNIYIFIISIIFSMNFKENIENKNNNLVLTNNIFNSKINNK